MPENVKPDTVARLWAALKKQQPRPRHDHAAEIYKHVVASGWASYIEIESLLIATDMRPIEFNCFSVRTLLEAFDVRLQWTFPRPRRGERESFGVEMVTAADLAHFLIALERTGFLVDPTPLCSELRPALKTRKTLIAAELAIWWHPQEQHRSSPQIFASGPRPTWGKWTEELITPAGYRAELFRDADDAPTALAVTAPKWRPNRQSFAA